MIEWKADRLYHVTRIVSEIEHAKWRYKTVARGANLLLYIEADETCNVTGKPMTWKSREWMLHPLMTDGEVVQTAFLATMTAIVRWRSSMGSGS